MVFFHLINNEAPQVQDVFANGKIYITEIF